MSHVLKEFRPSPSIQFQRKLSVFLLVYIFSKSATLSYSIRNTYNKIGTIQRRLAWPLRKDDTQNREAFHILLITTDLLI